MENIVKNIHKIKDFITEEQYDKIEYGGLLYRRYSRIYFKIISVNADAKDMVVKVWQEKNTAEKYLDNKQLIEKGKELLSPFFQNWAIHIHSTPYQEAPPESVTPQWIREQMNKYKISSKKMVADLGVAKAEISALINGHREMGIRTKGLFYYYFKYIELQQNNG